MSSQGRHASDMSWQVLGQIAFQEHFPIDGVAQDEETRLCMIHYLSLFKSILEFGRIM